MSSCSRKRSRSDFGASTSVAYESSVETTPTAEQRAVLDAIRMGHNVYASGPAGTGKSFILRRVCAEYRGDRSALFVTASTGIAAIQIGGCTLHSFAGIPDGNAPAERLIATVRRNQSALARWMRCGLLVVDEISMVSAEFLDKLDAIGRAVRGRPHDAFGGIQLLLLGDFFQLPPVAPARFAFEAVAWSAMQLVIVHLTTVFRQRDDPHFVALLADVRIGRVSDATREQLNRRLGVAPPPGVTPTKLRGTNREVDAENTRAYVRLTGPSRDYPAVYEGGDTREMNALRRSCPAPATLSLRVGAAVLLLKNVDVAAGLVNGSQGVVVSLGGGGGSAGIRYHGDFDEDDAGGWPTVRFDGGVVRVIRPMEWTATSGSEIVATIRQSSDDKSQGMQLQHVDLSSSGVFEFGQMYVALSRATSLDGVYLQRFDAGCIRAHPRVLEFYAGGDHKDNVEG